MRIVPASLSRSREALRGDLDRLALQGVSIRYPCGVCGRPDWCSVSADGGMAICMRVADGARRQARNGGYVHLLGHSAAPPPPPVDVRPIALPRDLPAVVEKGVARTTRGWLTALAVQLGLPSEGPDALRRLRCYREREEVAAFPMCIDGKITGVRYRARGGRKWSLRGGREGVLVPLDLATSVDTMAVVEGVTDAAAILALGIPALGRPSCRGAVAETVHLVTALRPRTVVVVLDRDEPGIVGGVALARGLASTCPDVRCVLPPPSHKDARAWIANGATREDVLAAFARGRRIEAHHA